MSPARPRRRRQSGRYSKRLRTMISVRSLRSACSTGDPLQHCARQQPRLGVARILRGYPQSESKGCSHSSVGRHEALLESYIGQRLSRSVSSTGHSRGKRSCLFSIQLYSGPGTIAHVLQQRCRKPSTWPAARFQQSHLVGFVIHAKFCNMRRLLAAFQQQPHLLR
jgi:hypothetical protein